jgi:hypothetical protein
MPSNPSINAVTGVSGFHGNNWCGSLATPSVWKHCWTSNPTQVVELVTIQTKTILQPGATPAHVGEVKDNRDYDETCIT